VKKSSSYMSRLLGVSPPGTSPLRAPRSPFQPPTPAATAPALPSATVNRVPLHSPVPSAAPSPPIPPEVRRRSEAPEATTSPSARGDNVAHATPSSARRGGPTEAPAVPSRPALHESGTERIQAVTREGEATPQQQDARSLISAELPQPALGPAPAQIVNDSFAPQTRGWSPMTAVQSLLKPNAPQAAMHAPPADASSKETAIEIGHVEVRIVPPSAIPRPAPRRTAKGQLTRTSPVYGIGQS
jgi:hypothetical protein